MSIGYVTNYGNIENDGLSWEAPKRSIQECKDSGGTRIYIRGYFNESLKGTLQYYVKIIGDGFSIVDGTLIPEAIDNLGIIENLVLQNFVNGFRLYSNGKYDCIINCIIRNMGEFNRSMHFQQSSKSLFYNNQYLGGTINLRDHNTIVGNVGDTIKFGTFGQNGSLTRTINNIISGFNGTGGVTISNHDGSANVLKYSLFHNCNFKFIDGDQEADETEFSAPTGANDNEKLESLRSRMASVFGGSASQYLVGCKYQTDGDLFINPDKGNFYLVPGCLASRMSYDAGYVGKYPEGSIADFIASFENYTNIDASGNIIDQTIDASAETNIIDLGKLRHINTFEAFGQRAARNGNQVNVNADLSSAINPGTNLVDSKTYLVRSEAISLTTSGKTRDVGETFIAKSDDGLAFTSGTGYVQEVFLNKTRSIEIKASKTDPTLANTQWIKMDLYGEPRVNYDENGLISHGNLDTGYDSETSERMYIRYWKVRVTIKAKNLPS